MVLLLLGVYAVTLSIGTKHPLATNRHGAIFTAGITTAFILSVFAFNSP
ncbi:MAG: hypothetical protein ABR909_11480 [Candidatus Bathyarchaeia archaeon]